MANFKTWHEETRAGNFLVRYRDGKTKLPNGRWKVFTECGVDKSESAMVDGKRLMGGKLAEALADKLLERHHQNKLGVASTSESLEDLVEQYLNDKKNLAWKTLEHYASSLNALKGAIPSVSELTTDNLLSWRTKMVGSKLANNTVFGRLNDTSMFCNWLVRSGKMASTPFVKLATGKSLIPEKDQPKPRFYMTEEYMKIDEVLETLSHHARVGFHLCLKFGLRKVEVVGDGRERMEGVLWEDLIYRPDGKVALHIRREVTKGQKKERTLLLNQRFLDMIGSRKTGPLCPLPRYVFDDLMQKAIKLSGVKKTRGKFVHSLRHTFGKNFLQQSGSNQPALRDIFGHTDVKTTEIYSQYETTYLDSAIETTGERMDIEESRIKAAGQKDDISGQIVLVNNLDDSPMTPKSSASKNKERINNTEQI